MGRDDDDDGNGNGNGNGQENGGDDKGEEKPKEEEEEIKIELNKEFSPNPEFLPRAVTYLSHKFPLRDDSTFFTFGWDEKKSRKEEVGNKDHGHPIYDEMFFHRPFWRDAPSHLHEDELMDIERLPSFHLSNPALRRTEYNKERCENEIYQDYKGTRIIQIYLEKGFPLEVPCYTCQINQTGLTTVYYLLPSRNFLTDIELHERRERFTTGKGSNVATPINSWLLHMIKNHQSHEDQKYDAQFVFGASRASGGHTSGEQQQILADDTGHLQIHITNFSYFVHASEQRDTVENFYGGLTLTCAQLVDNEPRSLGFIYNIDYLCNDNVLERYKPSLNYEQYERLDNTTELPFKLSKENLKIDVAWEDWSCCSACCCSVALCGLYANEKKCHEVDSYRTRRGLLSVFLLDPKKKVNIRNKTVSAELNKLFRISPYREKGFVIYSSFMLRQPRFKIHLFEEHLRDPLTYFLGKRGHDEFDDYAGVGMFHEEQDCSGMEQKMNCSVLAACRGEIVEEPPPPIEEQVPVDPCADLPIVTLSISESSSSFRYEQNTSYRLRIDGLDMETLKAVTWKVGGERVRSYDESRPCDEQGISVHQNGVDLLLIDVNATEIVDKVLEAFTGKRRFKIHFVVDKEEDVDVPDYRYKFMIAAVIGGCAAFILALISIIHSFVWRKRPQPSMATEKSRTKTRTERSKRKRKRPSRKVRV
ncbi:unnamed protein product [Cylicocyclus nassatus]|uniref:Uncharacterized protein n=1 Tax=Cylicocyclus nassatus TaxID=53992 RepID=A0AA36DVK1_CYLNA|nr:unnamed protein product [Cylicocyclus nassatus]